MASYLRPSLGDDDFQSRVQSYLGAAPRAPSAPGAPRVGDSSFAARVQSYLGGTAAPASPRAAPPPTPGFYENYLKPAYDYAIKPVLDTGRSVLNITGAGSGGVAGTLTGALGSDAYQRALEENTASEGVTGEPSVLESLRVAPGAGQVLAEAILPGEQTNPWLGTAKRIGGLAGDILLDPATYLTGGFSKAGKLTELAKILNPAEKAAAAYRLGLGAEEAAKIAGKGSEYLGKAFEAAQKGAQAYGAQGRLRTLGEAGLEAASTGIPAALAYGPQLVQGVVQGAQGAYQAGQEHGYTSPEFLSQATESAVMATLGALMGRGVVHDAAQIRDYRAGRKAEGDLKKARALFEQRQAQQAAAEPSKIRRPAFLDEGLDQAQPPGPEMGYGRGGRPAGAEPTFESSLEDALNVPPADPRLGPKPASIRGEGADFMLSPRAQAVARGGAPALEDLPPLPAPRPAAMPTEQDQAVTATLQRMEQDLRTAPAAQRFLVRGAGDRVEGALAQPSVKGELGLGHLPEGPEAIAEAIREDGNNPIYLAAQDAAVRADPYGYVDEADRRAQPRGDEHIDETEPAQVAPDEGPAPWDVQPEQGLAPESDLDAIINSVLHGGPGPAGLPPVPYEQYRGPVAPRPEADLYRPRMVAVKDRSPIVQSIDKGAPELPPDTPTQRLAEQRDPSIAADRAADAEARARAQEATAEDIRASAMASFKNMYTGHLPAGRVSLSPMIADGKLVFLDIVNVNEHGEPVSGAKLSLSRNDPVPQAIQDIVAKGRNATPEERAQMEDWVREHAATSAPYELRHKVAEGTAEGQVTAVDRIARDKGSSPDAFEPVRAEMERLGVGRSLPRADDAYRAAQTGRMSSLDRSDLSVKGAKALDTRKATMPEVIDAAKLAQSNSAALEAATGLDRDGVARGVVDLARDGQWEFHPEARRVLQAVKEASPEMITDAHLEVATPKGAPYIGVKPDGTIALGTQNEAKEFRAGTPARQDSRGRDVVSRPGDAGAVRSDDTRPLEALPRDIASSQESRGEPGTQGAPSPAGSGSRVAGVQAPVETASVRPGSEEAGRAGSAAAETAELPKVKPSFRASEDKTPGNIGLEHVKQAFKGREVKATDDGAFEVSLPGDRTVRVQTDGSLELDPAAFREGYGREAEAGERAVGSYQRIGPDALIRLAKQGGTERTLDHETFHAAMDLALHPKEKAAVLRRYGSEEAAAEAYAHWQPKVGPPGAIAGLFHKIKNFFTNIWHSFRPTAESAFGAVRSGKAFGREVKDVAPSRGVAYSAKGEPSEHVTEKLVPEPEQPVPEKPPHYPVNVERISTTEDVKDGMRKIVAQREKELGAAKGYRSWEEAHEAALRAGLTSSDIKRLMEEEGAFTDHQIEAIRIMREEAFKDARAKAMELEEARQKGKGVEDAEIAYESAAAKAAGVMYASVKAGAEAGRALAIHRKLSKGLDVGEKFYRQLVKSRPEAAKGLLDVLIRTPDDVKAITDATRAAYKPSMASKIYWVWLNGILSGIPTHVANAVGNTIFQGMRLTEKGVAAAIDPLVAKTEAGAEGPRIRPEEVYAAAQGLMSGMPRGMKVFADTMAGRVFDPDAKVEHVAPIGGKAGAVLGAPTRALLASDSLMKAAIFTSEVHRQAMRKALHEGAADPKMRALEIAEDVLSLPNILDDAKDATIKNPDVAEAARKEALYATFNQRLGKFGNMLVGARDADPTGLAKVIAPFMRTPMNITKATLERTPLNFLRILHKIKNGELKGAAISEELAKPMVGTMLGMTFVSLAQAGLLTGGGPTEPDKRRNLQDTGWQPYSLHINGRYYNLQRFEPISSILGMAADMAELKDEKNLGDQAAKISGSIAENLTNKTFLSGVVNFFNAVSDPKREAASYIKSLEGSVVPSIIGRAAQATDPQLRETKVSDLSPIAARVPGWSRTLPPRLGASGEPVERAATGLEAFVSPFPVSEDKPGAEVQHELNRLDMHPPTPPSGTTIRGVKVDYEPREMAVVTAAYKRAADQVRRVMRTSMYQRLPDTPDDRRRLGQQTKQDLIQDIYRRAQAEAKTKISGSVLRRAKGAYRAGVES